jgi:nicotinate-nucleotide adenylyltransferase
MVQRAIADHPAFTTSALQLNSCGTSYAIDTLIDLSALYPNTHWYWILGLDAFQTLPRWYRGGELAVLCDWLIAPRCVSFVTIAESESICKQVEQQLMAQSIDIRWQLLHMPMLEISSSLIRCLCRDRKSIRYLVPEAVRSYIAAHNLYSDNSE